MQTPGSITALFAALAQIQARVPDHALLAALEPLHTYAVRPDTPDLPALWNWLDDGSTQQMDTRRLRDIVTVETRIAVRYTDAAQRAELLFTYYDAYRDVVDPYFRNAQGPLPVPPVVGGTATWAARTRLRNFTEDFGGTLAFGVAMLQEFHLDRPILPPT